MSHVKTNKISPRKGTTTTIGDSGDSVTISSGTTTTNAGTISTAGITGGTINNTTGSIEGLQQQVSWQTGSIKTANFTASANEGYFLNTTSGQITVTLPASPSAGDVVAVKDYADTFDTNKAILNANGNKIQGSTENFDITVEGTAAILLYVDSTKGWLLVDQSKAADIAEGPAFVVATGGTILTCGNFKTHVFTGPGTFCVSQSGNPDGNDKLDYLVVAGGGGGNGAGGFRLSNVHALPAPTTSPLANPTGITATVTAYPITVGSGGAQGGNPGSNSIFSTITSAGGGGGAGANGGSGASGQAYAPNPVGAGSGNTPPVSPPQGNPAGTLSNPVNPSGSSIAFNGGGGAGAASNNITVTQPCGAMSPNADGGIGSYIADSFLGPTAPSYGTPGPVSSTRYFAGGGAGMSQDGAVFREGGVGGAGGGGNACQGPNPLPNSRGTVNTGGGGAMDYSTNNSAGGSGIVIIRYKFQ